MEKIDLSTNSKKIQETYDKIVRGDPSTSYAVYSVDKNSTLSVTEVGSGSLDEFVTHFNDGQIQFGLARVSVPGSDVSKNLLLGWCPDNAPAKSRLSFASNFAEISKVLSGYHVQITARDQDDLDVDEFLNRIGAAAGARYSIQNSSSSKASSKPTPALPKPIVTKPTPKPVPAKPASFIPKSTGKPIAPVAPKPAVSKFSSKDDEDEWGGEKEIQERDFEKVPLDDVPSAYKPTKVNLAELRKQKSDTISSVPKPFVSESETETKQEEPQSLNDRIKVYKSNESSSIEGRLTSLPKPKVNNTVASRFVSATKSTSPSAPTFGSKPTFGYGSSNDNRKEKIIGGLSRDFAAEGGKTPAQIWAEKRGQYKSVSPESEETPSSETSGLSEKFSTQLSVKDELEKEETSSVNISPNEPSQYPKRDIPPTPKEIKEEEKEESSEESQAPSLPTRNLPPIKHTETRSDETEDETPALGLPARNLPPPVRQRFPISNAEEEKEEEPVPALPSRNTESEQKETIIAIAEYDYEKDEDNEIAFTEGDLIVDIEFVDEDWWSGKHSKTDEIGLFPSSYVVLQDKKVESSTSAHEQTPSTVTETKSSSPTAIAEYDYEKDEDNEIAFTEGDLIVDIEFVDEDWWSGKHSKTGEIGLFPANYVKLNN